MVWNYCVSSSSLPLSCAPVPAPVVGVPVEPKLQAVLLSDAALEMGSALVSGAAASDEADDEADTQAGMPADEANDDADEDIEADEASDEPPVAVPASPAVPAAADPVASDVGDLGELMREKNFVMAFGLDLVLLPLLGLEAAAAAAAVADAACPCVMASA